MYHGQGNEAPSRLIPFVLGYQNKDLKGGPWNYTNWSWLAVGWWDNCQLQVTPSSDSVDSRDILKLTIYRTLARGAGQGSPHLARFGVVIRHHRFQSGPTNRLQLYRVATSSMSLIHVTHVFLQVGASRLFFSIASPCYSCVLDWAPLEKTRFQTTISTPEAVRYEIISWYMVLSHPSIVGMTNDSV